MKSVMISIHPKWCELIASGKKTIEVRKTKPKALPPFKCYIYCTQTDELVSAPGWPGRVIGEFVCNEIQRYARYGLFKEPARYMKSSPGGYPATEIHYSSLQLSPDALEQYGKGAQLYGWHISDLKLYAEPKEISEFKRWNRTEQTAPCAHVYALYAPCESCKECNLKRPPESWCYVEETE